MARTTNKARLVPRQDVGGGTLIGAVSIMLLLMQHDAVFHFDAVSGALGVILIFVAGYFPARFKSFIMASSAVVASLVAALLGWVFFESPFDPNIVSFQLATFIVALGGYVLPARDPDANVAGELDAALGAELDRHNRAQP